MSYLLDTNVTSEFVKPLPSPHVLSWFGTVDEGELFISVVTLAEVSRGIEQLPAGARRARLETWFATELLERFSGRIMPIGAEIAVEWGRIVAARQKAGRTISTMDSLIAATAHCHDLKLVTRNTADFENLGLNLINPWIEGAS